MAKRPNKPAKRTMSKRQKAAKRDFRVVPPTFIDRLRTDAERARTEDFEARQRERQIKDLIEFDGLDIAILELTIRHPYLTQEQIGQHEKVRLSRSAVCERMTSEKFKRALASAARPAIEILESNKAAAARKLGELLNSKDERVSIRAAIAHLWPDIHKGEGKSGEDFVSFIQEAFERNSPAKASSA